MGVGKFTGQGLSALSRRSLSTSQSIIKESLELLEAKTMDEVKTLMKDVNDARKLEMFIELMKVGVSDPPPLFEEKKNYCIKLIIPLIDTIKFNPHRLEENISGLEGSSMSGIKELINKLKEKLAASEKPASPAPSTPSSNDQQLTAAANKTTPAQTEAPTKSLAETMATSSTIANFMHTKSRSAAVQERPSSGDWGDELISEQATRSLAAESATQGSVPDQSEKEAVDRKAKFAEMKKMIAVGLASNFGPRPNNAPTPSSPPVSQNPIGAPSNSMLSSFIPASSSQPLSSQSPLPSSFNLPTGNDGGPPPPPPPPTGKIVLKNKPATSSQSSVATPSAIPSQYTATSRPHNPIARTAAIPVHSPSAMRPRPLPRIPTPNPVVVVPAPAPILNPVASSTPVTPGVPSVAPASIVAAPAPAPSLTPPLITPTKKKGGASLIAKVAVGSLLGIAAIFLGKKLYKNYREHKAGTAPALTDT